MKHQFELWDSVSANLVGVYESIPSAIAELELTFAPGEDRSEIENYVLVLNLKSHNEPIVILDGQALLDFSDWYKAGLALTGAQSRKA